MAFQNGTYFFIFSDQTEYPQQIKMVHKFVRSEKAKGIEQKIGKFMGKKYEFATSDGYYHRILIIKVDDREYAFQTTGQAQDDVLTEQFFAGLQFGKSRVTAQPSGNNSLTATISPLKITFKAFPSYNDFGRFYSISGAVKLRVAFEPNGTIGAIEPVTKLPFALIDQAIKAAKQIKFEPETINGVQQQTTKFIEYHFAIL